MAQIPAGRGPARPVPGMADFDVPHALVNGAAGIVSGDESGEAFSGMGLTVRDGMILEIDVLADPNVYVCST